MKKGDSPAMIVYPPDDLSDEGVYAMSEFLHEVCRAFEQHYHRRITRLSWLGAVSLPFGYPSVRERIRPWMAAYCGGELRSVCPVPVVVLFWATRDR